MAYEWTNGELITAEKLNQTGGGEESLVITATMNWEKEIATMDKTWQEIYDAFISNRPCIVTYTEGSENQLHTTVGLISSLDIETEDGEFVGGSISIFNMLGFNASSADDYPSATL